MDFTPISRQLLSPKIARLIKKECSLCLFHSSSPSKTNGMKIKSLVNIASWNLLKEDDNKIYEEEILQIKAKYGEEVTEDQIEGRIFPVFGHF